VFYEILVPLLAFALVLVLCYCTTKFIGSRFSGGKRNKIMKIIETLPLGLDRYLYLIKAGKKYFLFQSSKKGMQLVSEIEMEEQEIGSQDSDESANVFEFKKIFENYSGLSKKIENADPETESGGILGSIKRLQKINHSKE